MARLQGHEASLDLLDEFRDRARMRDMQAALQAERVIAQMDSFNEDGARQALDELRRDYPDTDWAEWADEAEYEIATLMPGRLAPEIAATSD
jgi:predicted Zn-dependent protease